MDLANYGLPGHSAIEDARRSTLKKGEYLNRMMGMGGCCAGGTENEEVDADACRAGAYGSYRGKA